MFKFIKQYAASIDNVQVYPLFSLLVFFVFFVALLWIVKKMDSKAVEQRSNIPFDSEMNTSN